MGFVDRHLVSQRKEPEVTDYDHDPFADSPAFLRQVVATDMASAFRIGGTAAETAAWAKDVVKSAGGLDDLDYDVLACLSDALEDALNLDERSPR